MNELMIAAEVECFAEVLFERLLAEPEDADALGREELASALRRFLRRHHEAELSGSPDSALELLAHALDSVAEAPRPAPRPWAEVQPR